MSYIPQASINDLISTHNSATSAKPTSPPSNPISDFISMLGKYAQPAIQAIQSNPQVQQVENSPVGQLVQGKFGNIIPAAKQLYADAQSGKYNPQLNIGGEMEEVPGAGFNPSTGLPKLGGQSLEAMNDAAGGWKTGQKAQFDQALANGDSNTVQKLLPDVPDYYKTRMNDRIASIKPQYGYDNQATAPIPPGGEQLPPLGAKKTQGLPPIGDNPQNAGNPPLSEKPPMITKNKADPKAVAAYQSIFQVPRAVADKMKISQNQVVNQLIDDGVTGVKNLDELKNIGQNITGTDEEGNPGAFPNINNYILSKTKAPVDYSDATSFIKTDLPKVLEGEKPSLINEVNNEVSKAMTPLNYNRPGELPSNMPEGHGYATDLYKTSQNIGKLANMYQDQSQSTWGETMHPEHLRISKALYELKNNIDDAIDGATSQDYAQYKNDPYVQGQLQRVPEGVSQRYMNGASRFKDGQTIQAPYVSLLRNMIRHTENSQTSAFTKALQASQQTPASETLANNVADNIPAPKIVKTVMGGALKNMVKPFDKSQEDYFQQNTSGEAPSSGSSAKMKIPGGKLTKTIVGGGLILGGTALGMEMKGGNQKSNADSNKITGNSDNGHNGNIPNTPLSVNSQLETDISKVKPDSTPSDPRTITGSDGKSLAMSDGQYQTATAALDALVKQDPSYITNPIKAGQLKAAQDAINTKYSASQKLMNSYQKVSTVSQKIADAQSLLKETSPVLTDKIGFLEGGHEMLDPKYQSLVNDLNFIENSDPRLKGQLSNLATGGSVKTALENAAKLLLSEHNQLLKSYGAGTPETTSVKATTPSQIPAGLPAPVDGALPPMHTGSYQFTAPNPMFQ